MNNSADMVLRNEEKAIYRLRALYRQHGYSHYKVSKFEEYDLLEEFHCELEYIYIEYLLSIVSNLY